MTLMQVIIEHEGQGIEVHVRGGHQFDGYPRVKDGLVLLDQTDGHPDDEDAATATVYIYPDEIVAVRVVN